MQQGAVAAVGGIPPAGEVESKDHLVFPTAVVAAAEDEGVTIGSGGETFEVR
jgi:hypothetical protein